MTTVLITGAGGFIARNVAKMLQQEGMKTIGISRKTLHVPFFDTIYTASLGESLNPFFRREAIDVLVHCAHHGGKKEHEINIQGTMLWMEEARAHGVELQIFLSSLLARRDALSEYGRVKFELERHFVTSNQVVYRPGLVVGKGGMFGKMKKSIKRLPVVPLLDRGKTRVYVTGIDFLCSVIRDCIFTKGNGLRGRAWAIHQPNTYDLQAVMMSIRRRFRYSCWFLPVPSSLVLGVLQAAERVPFITLPLRSTNIKGLKQSGQENCRSDFDMFGYPEEDLDALIKKIDD